MKNEKISKTEKNEKNEKTAKFEKNEKNEKLAKTEKFEKILSKSLEQQPSKNSAPIRFSCLMNLISKGKAKPKSDEIDLFEDEPKASSDSYKNVELENYWVFLKNNMGSKNILVIPIEDDDEKEQEDLGLFRFPYAEMAKFNEIYDKNRGKIQKIKGKPQKLVVSRIKWNNCFSMDIPASFQKPLDFPHRKPKLFQLN